MTRHRARQLVLLRFCIAASLWFPGELSRADGHDSSSHPDSITVHPNANVTADQFKQALDSLYEKISTSYSVVQPMLEKSCYDCHSDQTRYPWYSRLPIAKQIINTDIQTARENLDMSDGFPFGGKMSQEEQLKEIREEVEWTGMPPWTYRLMHWGHTIEGEHRDTLFQWIDSSLKALEQVRDVYSTPEP